MIRTKSNLQVNPTYDILLGMFKVGTKWILNDSNGHFSELKEDFSGEKFLNALKTLRKESNKDDLDEHLIPFFLPGQLLGLLGVVLANYVFDSNGARHSGLWAHGSRGRAEGKSCNVPKRFQYGWPDTAFGNESIEML